MWLLVKILVSLLEFRRGRKIVIVESGGYVVEEIEVVFILNR